MITAFLLSSVRDLRLPITRAPATRLGRFGATRRIRTGDLLITNQLLYRLS
jgi:hypothetical protein